MRRLISILSKLFFLLALVIAHFFISYSLPFPFNTINIIFASIMLFMVLSESGVIVWMAFFTHLCIELYSVSPFGIILFSSTTSILLTYWLFQSVVTNRSWYSTIFLTFISLFLYRFISLLLLVVVQLFTPVDTTIPWANTFFLAGWELLFTEIAVITGYTLIPKLRKTFRKKKSTRFL